MLAGVGVVVPLDLADINGASDDVVNHPWTQGRAASRHPALGELDRAGEPSITHGVHYCGIALSSQEFVEDETDDFCLRFD